MRPAATPLPPDPFWLDFTGFVPPVPSEEWPDFTGYVPAGEPKSSDDRQARSGAQRAPFSHSPVDR